MADWINLLHSSVDVASHSPQCICTVTDVSTPSLPLQSVTVFCLWHVGELYDNWSVASLAMSQTASNCRWHLSGLQCWFGRCMSGTCLLQLCKRALFNNGCVSSLGTTLVPIHLQSVGVLALTPPK
jgi:hypothetical protein